MKKRPGLNFAYETLKPMQFWLWMCLLLREEHFTLPFPIPNRIRWKWFSCWDLGISLGGDGLVGSGLWEGQKDNRLHCSVHAAAQLCIHYLAVYAVCLYLHLCFGEILCLRGYTHLLSILPMSHGNQQWYWTFVLFVCLFFSKGSMLRAWAARLEGSSWALREGMQKEGG